MALMGISAVNPPEAEKLSPELRQLYWEARHMQARSLRLLQKACDLATKEGAYAMQDDLWDVCPKLTEAHFGLIEIEKKRRLIP